MLEDDWDKLTCPKCDKPLDEDVELIKCFKCGSSLLRFYNKFERTIPKGASYIGLPGYFIYYVQCAMCKWSTVLNIMPLNPNGDRLCRGEQETLRYHVGCGPNNKLDLSPMLKDLEARGKSAWDIHGIYFEHPKNDYSVVIHVTLYGYKDHM